MTDGEIEDLVGDFVQAAAYAQELGFDFVDIKHCHGYLGHEFLSAYTRPGPYGGSFENRTRFLCQIVTGILIVEDLAVVVKGHDPQLEKAIELALEGLEEFEMPTERPPFPTGR